MKVPVFIILLICVLVGSTVNTFAGVEFHASRVASSLHFKKEVPVVVSCAEQSPAFTTGTSLPEEDKLLICEDAEDEDGNDLSSKKYRSAAGFPYIPDFGFLINIQHLAADPLPFHSSRLSYRYILHRTLRI